VATAYAPWHANALILADDAIIDLLADIFNEMLKASLLLAACPIYPLGSRSSATGVCCNPFL
jgi:hypothetical protein